MTTQTIETYLESLVDWEKRPIPRGAIGPERMGRILDALDRPDAAVPIIQVAGTNGKGSVATMVASCLKEAGLRVGRTSSPHVFTVHERILIGETPISDEDLKRTLDQVRPVFESSEDTRPTYFEATTALALEYFRTESVDVAVLEVGLGGPLDATSATDPQVAVVTSIGLDHTRQLGETESEIAREKAKIARSGKPLVLGGMSSDARNAALAIAHDQLALPVIAPESIGLTIHTVGLDGTSITLTSSEGDILDCQLQLIGRHQAENARTAVAVLDAFATVKGPIIGAEARKQGLESAHLPGRFEINRGNPLTILDGAHNPQALNALRATMDEAVIQKLDGREIGIVFGTMEDKDLEGLLGPLSGIASTFCATRVPSPRSLDPSAVADHATDVAPNIHYRENPLEAFECVQTAIGPDGIILVTGSLYLVGNFSQA